MKKLNWKKSVSLIVLCSQLGAATSVFASASQTSLSSGSSAVATRAAGGETQATGSAGAMPAMSTGQNISPEMQFVEGILVLQGQKLSSQKTADKVKELVSQYSSVAQGDGQSQRMQEALVELGLYTPSQAASFVSEVRASTTKVVASADSQQSASFSSDVRQVATEAIRLAQLRPAGAQFSTCAITDVLDPAPMALLGLIVGFIGLGIYDDDANTPNMEAKSLVEDQAIMYSGFGLFIAEALLSYTSQNCDN